MTGCWYTGLGVLYFGRIVTDGRGIRSSRVVVFAHWGERTIGRRWSGVTWFGCQAPLGRCRMLSVCGAAAVAASRLGASVSGTAAVRCIGGFVLGLCQTAVQPLARLSVYYFAGLSLKVPSKLFALTRAGEGGIGRHRNDWRASANLFAAGFETFLNNSILLMLSI